METFRFPSKTFLLGEYAILKGASALLLGHPPYFTATLEESATAQSPFHPESLAGRWLQQNPAEYKIRLADPHEGRGGYGGSGAEFLAAWVAGKSVPSAHAPHAIFAWGAWEDSRSFPGAGSGADILTQAFGCNRTDGPFFLEVDVTARTLNEIYARRHQGILSLFHTGRKLATHEQKEPAALPVEELEDMVLRAGQQLEAGIFHQFAQLLSQYGKRLAELGLEAPHTAQALAGVRGLPGVLGAKGCGAMGADVIVVAHEAEADLVGWARENSLALTGEFPV